MYASFGKDEPGEKKLRIDPNPGFFFLLWYVRPCQVIVEHLFIEIIRVKLLWEQKNDFVPEMTRENID